MTAAEILAADERDRQRLRQIESADEDIHCDRCGKFICFVYACDLNGSYFLCVECKEGLKSLSAPALKSGTQRVP